MTNLEFVNGDILNTKANIIVQQVNHRGVMGSGLAKQIRNKYPEIFDGYASMCKTHTFKDLMRQGLVCWYYGEGDDGKVQYIASVFGQEYYGTDRRHTNYFSLLNGIRSVFDYADIQGYSVAIPYGIGCGLGGGDWEIVLTMIKDVLKYYPTLKVYVYKNSPLDNP